jgi:L-seryl-tRNA(Ser) seleniumtransferase
MLETGRQELLRSLPAVDVVLRAPAAEALARRHGRATMTAAVRDVLAAARREILAGADAPSGPDAVLSRAANLLATRGLRRVINATGVVLHTNLGRSVLSARARAAAVEVASRYSNLEYDLAQGRRGSRYDHAVALLRQLTGAEDALVVNNCAAATLLALAAAVAEHERGEDADGAPDVIVSRGQLIEIGGGFRIPEVLELSGARLREVGTTNRTRLSDYERAMSRRTCAVLWVHPSNFETVGFTQSVGVEDLVSLGLPVIADVGSGAMVRMGGEPLARDAVRAGAAVVTFSGDKLLGGPQAGISVGTGDFISRMRAHPLTRAVRADKLCLAALEVTLKSYLEGTATEELPTLAMFFAPLSEVEDRARALARTLESVAGKLEVSVVSSIARSGGGTMPTYEVPSSAVRLAGPDVDELAGKLRAADPPVVGRVHEGGLLLDARTLLEGDEDAIVEAVRDLLE